MCPQACSAYDRDEICGAYKSCATHTDFQIKHCPMKCLNFLEPRYIQYPDCNKEDTQKYHPITCGIEPFPGNFT